MTTQSNGWDLTLTHPTTGRTISVDVLDNPEFLPSLNNLVEARIPVRKSQDLLKWPDGTTVNLTLGGEEQPLDEVVDIQQQSDRTIIVADGGIELDSRVRTEFREERRHIAAENVIQNNMTYTADIDTPSFSVVENSVLQTASTTLNFEDLLEIENTTPYDVSGDSITSYQSCFVEDVDGGLSDVNYSNGSAEELSGISDNTGFTFTTQYEAEFQVGFRGQITQENDFSEITVEIDGVDIGSLFPPDSLAWDQGPTVTLSAGSHDVSLILPDGGSGFAPSDVAVDVIAVYDPNFTYTFDNTVNQDNGYLDGPELYPNANDIVFSDATTAFVIEDATTTLTIDDTSNEQAVALSGDRGDTYTENQNSDTVTATGLESPQVRLRVTLSRHSPDGPQNETPRLGYASQELDAFEITADIRQESLLIDQTFDDSVESVLNQIAGDEYIWSYRLENGTPTISWTQPGQRTADSDPDIEADVSVSKSVKTWDAVTIKGSAQSASGEEFSGSTSFVDLARDNIVPGSEAVRGTSNGTQFVRSEDYEMKYNPGEIRILDTGDMSAGTTYEIDYRYEVEGSHPDDYTGTNELVETISGVVSDRQAQQLAYTILEIDPAVADPSWSADVLLPRGDSLFDPLEALSLEQLELPDEAVPLEIREPPQETPRGIQLRLGSRRGLDESLNALSRQLRSVSRRS